MRTINKTDIEAIALGSTVLGTGGGGDPYIGKLLTLASMKNHGDVNLISVDELADDAFVVPIAAFGAPLILIEKLFAGTEFDAAFEMMEAYFGKKIDAVMPIEAGGLNGVLPFAVAASKGVPIVDADGMGRAFPRLEMVTFTLHGISASPITQADEKGNRCIYHTINNTWGETLVGATTMQMGGSCVIGCYPMTGAQVKKASIRDTISYAQTLGNAILQAKENNKNPIEALVQKAQAMVLFSGKVSNVTIQVEGRWNKGLCQIVGLDDCLEQTMLLHFQNEFLMATVDDKAVGMTPDLLVLVDAENALPITAETVKYGTRVIVLGMKANEQWRTPAGIALAGPHNFGYDLEYVPIENLQK